MGFWDVVGRIAQGKPAFEVPPARGEDWDDDAPTVDYAEDREAKQAAAHPETGLYDEKGYKHPPVMAATHVKTDLNRQSFDLWVTLKNQSDRDAHLDKMIIFGSTFGLNYPLSAGDQRVFRIYSGPLLTHDNYHKAELYYRDSPTGDYFRADHLIEYHYEHEAYQVVGLKLLMPINDV